MFENFTTTELKEKAEKLEIRIRELRNQPNSRQSAVGGLIQEAWVIREWENKDEELGKIKGEIRKRETPDETEELYFICYDAENYHIVPYIIQHGILKSGGLLPNYFIGRPKEEHDSYIIGRHEKQSTKIEIIDSSIEEPHGGQGDKLGNITVKLNDKIFIFNTKYRIPIESKDYFYIEFYEKHINLSGEGNQANKYQRAMIAYAFAYEFRNKFLPNKNICIR